MEILIFSISKNICGGIDALRVPTGLPHRRHHPLDASVCLPLALALCARSEITTLFARAQMFKGKTLRCSSAMFYQRPLTVHRLSTMSRKEEAIEGDLQAANGFLNAVTDQPSVCNVTVPKRMRFAKVDERLVDAFKFIPGVPVSPLFAKQIKSISDVR